MPNACLAGRKKRKAPEEVSRAESAAVAAADLGPDDSEDNVLDLCAAEEDVASLPEVCQLLMCEASKDCKGLRLYCSLCVGTRQTMHAFLKCKEW